MGELDSLVLAGAEEGNKPVRRFTAGQANSSLVLVTRIVKDILALYCQAKVLEERYSVLDRETDRDERVGIKRQYESLLRQLHGFNQELMDVGCRLRHWQTGVVDWPAVYNDRDVFLCWRMGEERIEYFHEAFESFAARKRLPDDFD